MREDRLPLAESRGALDPHALIGRFWCVEVSKSRCEVSHGRPLQNNGTATELWHLLGGEGNLPFARYHRGLRVPLTGKRWTARIPVVGWPAASKDLRQASPGFGGGSWLMSILLIDKYEHIYIYKYIGRLQAIYFGWGIVHHSAGNIEWRRSGILWC